MVTDITTEGDWNSAYSGFCVQVGGGGMCEHVTAEYTIYRWIGRPRPVRVAIEMCPQSAPLKCVNPFNQGSKISLLKLKCLTEAQFDLSMGMTLHVLSIQDYI